MKRIVFIVTAAMGLGGVSVRSAEITLPAETARLRESALPGYALAVTHCYTCHSTDYVQFQPSTTTRATWKASVLKMQKTFGAPIPDAAVEAIAEYLGKTYGAERSASAVTPTGATTAPAGATGDAALPSSEPTRR